MKKRFITIGFSITSVALLAASHALAFTYQSPPLVMSYDTSGSYTPDEGTSVKADSQGNVYMAVTTGGENGKIVKYSPSGQTLWVKEFDQNNPRPADKNNYLKSKGISAVAVDKSDNIYAVGESSNGASLDCLLKKYNANGDLVWQTRYSTPLAGTSGYDNYCKDVTVDNAGDIIAGGSMLSFTGAYAGDNFNQILKWNAAGQLIGKFNFQTHGDAACGRSLPCGMNIEKITTDIDRNIYTVEYNNVIYGRRFAKYSPTFQILKATAEQNPLSSPETFVPFDLGVDSAGHVYAGGQQQVPNTEGGYDWYNKMIVMDTGLNQLCEDKRKYYTNTIPGYKPDAVFKSVAIAPNDNALLSGIADKDFLAMEYNAQCQPQWRDASGAAVPIKARVDYMDFANAGTLDGQNNLIITGYALQADMVNLKAVSLKFTRNPMQTSSDLVVVTASAPASAKTGQALTVSGRIKNQGTGATGDAVTGFTYAGVYVSTDSTITRQDTLLCRAPINALSAGAEQLFTCTGTLPNLSSGAYSIGVLADDGNVIAETIESNNTWAGPLQFTALPDLVVTNLTFPASRMSGETLTVTGTFKNQGPGKTVQSYTGYVVMSPDSTVTTSDNWICTMPVGVVEPGATKDFSCTMTLPTNNTNWYAGNYYIGAFVYDTEETDNTNNTLAKPFKLIPPPVPSDLVITDAYSTASVQRGQQMTVTGTARNQGFGPTGTTPYTGLFFISIFLSQDSVITTADTFVCFYGSGKLQPGTNVPFTCTGTVPSTIAPGNYTVGVVADDGNYIIETDETNNIKTFGIVITP